MTEKPTNLGSGLKFGVFDQVFQRRHKMHGMVEVGGEKPLTPQKTDGLLTQIQSRRSLDLSRSMTTLQSPFSKLIAIRQIPSLSLFSEIEPVNALSKISFKPLGSKL